MSGDVQNAGDAIHIAAQLGRLDFISALLAVVALILGLSAIPTFWYLRMRAREVAEARIAEFTEGLDERIEREAISKMEKELPILVEQYMELMENAVTDQQADEIADAQDGDKDANDVQ